MLATRFFLAFSWSSRTLRKVSKSFPDSFCMAGAAPSLNILFCGFPAFFHSFADGRVNLFGDFRIFAQELFGSFAADSETLFLKNITVARFHDHGAPCLCP